MKMNRDQLKALIKECLVEILNEGLAGGLATPARRLSPMATEQRSPGRRKPGFDPRLDTPVGQAGPTNALREAIKESAAGNPVMAAIFADTARTTLPAMLQHGDVGPASPGSSGAALVQQEQFHGTPEQAFGEDSVGRWASLAFMESPAKKTA